MRTKTKALLVAGVAALISSAAAGGSIPQVPRAETNGYPWVQLPAPGENGVAQRLPVIASPAGVQPPAPLGTVTVPTVAPSVSYPWVQLPARVGARIATVAPPTTGYRWTQPPAWIPIG